MSGTEQVFFFYDSHSSVLRIFQSFVMSTMVSASLYLCCGRPRFSGAHPAALSLTQVYFEDPDGTDLYRVPPQSALLPVLQHPRQVALGSLLPSALNTAHKGNPHSPSKFSPCRDHSHRPSLRKGAGRGKSPSFGAALLNNLGCEATGWLLPGGLCRWAVALLEWWLLLASLSKSLGQQESVLG